MKGRGQGRKGKQGKKGKGGGTPKVKKCSEKGGPGFAKPHKVKRAIPDFKHVHANGKPKPFFVPAR